MTEIAQNHHAHTAWRRVMAHIRREMTLRQIHAAQTVVLVPFAQLMQEAHNAWVLEAPWTPCFVPRFETTQNWTRSLGGFEPGGDDIRLDAAHDALIAAALLTRAGLAERQSVLVPRLMEAAWSLAKLAAALPPDERLAWGERQTPELALGLEGPVLALEVAVARIALAWAASSSYPTDILFSAQPDLLVVIEGFQTEPLATVLRRRLGLRAISLSLDACGEAAAPGNADALSAGTCPTGVVSLRSALDAEDEAQVACACVLAHLNQGRRLVALVAIDRLLTRRVRAMLGERGIAVRDETGWKLSTTRAAATLMGLLRASPWDASTDAVLDCLKNAPGFDARAVTALEIEVRKAGLRDWRGVCAVFVDSVQAGTANSASGPVTESLAPPARELSPVIQGLVASVNALLMTLRRPRALTTWLHDLRSALQAAGCWQGLRNDPAGQAVLLALCLQDDGEAAEDGAVPASAGADLAAFTAPMSLSEFTAWVSQTCEAGSFLPAHPAQAQVVILPLSQLLGRALPAVVLPGCDEVHLAMSGDPPGQWTPRQREHLGLPSRDALALALRQSWQWALQFPFVDVLWRTSEGGERLMPSGLVQTLLLQGARPALDDPRTLRALTPQPCSMPQPVGDAFPVTRLSSSAYEDLRRCPYRFFALRQLKLQASEEIDNELGKREFGNWLHGLLKHFHEALKESNSALVPESIDRVAMINIAAQQATRDLGLSQAEFLPFAAAWPRVRAGYLQWLEQHEARGATFVDGEIWKEMGVGDLTLVGKIDRIDRLADGTTFVMDYKTEPRAQTALRIKPAAQDTQLAFYGALLSDDVLGGAYINLGEKDPTQTYEQSNIVHLRDELIAGIMDDVSRIADGAPLKAMGEGKACDYCAARGLCRKDFWTSP